MPGRRQRDPTLFDGGDSADRFDSPEDMTGAPLATRMRPRTVDEVVGQAELLQPGAPLRTLLSGESASSVILWGPPGSGKTTLAFLASRAEGRRFVQLSAVAAGVREVRAAIDEARSLEVATILFIDEVHRFSRTQQDALLPAVENGWVTLVAATTENPTFALVAPLLSRCILLTLEHLDSDDLGRLIDRAVADERGLAGSVRLDDQARQDLIRLAGGDARRALTYLEAAARSAQVALRSTGGAAPAASGDSELRSSAGPAPSHDPNLPVGGAPFSGATESAVAESAEAPAGPAAAVVTAHDVALAVQRALVQYDRAGDQHYDVISAYIKSVRGSDVDAALHYLARMIEAGEDPRFIARRLVILASEDVGMADPAALGVAVAAMQASASIGLPEARITLAQATIHLAGAPKSNAVVRAINAAQTDVRAGRIGSVPAHLRSSHAHGGGDSYRYPHDDPAGVIEQEYPPGQVRDRVYYEPTDHGAESGMRSILERLRRVVRGSGD